MWGPSNIPIILGARCFVIFINDYTQVSWVFLLKQKSEVSQVLKNFINLSLGSLVVYPMSMFVLVRGKLDPKLLSAYLLATQLPKKHTNVTTLQQNNFLCLEMSPLMKIYNIFNLIFKRRSHALKIRIICSYQ